MVDVRLSLIDNSFQEDNLAITLEQYVQDVVDFSSQYGSDISISYTAYNISGKPSKFPDYGDFPQAFVMRTYGKWWNEAPSCLEPIMPQNNSPIISQDYIGSVVRIWAGDRVGKWKCLWEGEPQVVGHSPRIFSPSIRPIDFPTCLLRLEFDHSRLEYYTELDAVLLPGKPLRQDRKDGKDITSQIKELNLQALSIDVDLTETLNSLSSLTQHYSALLEDINLEMETLSAPVSGLFSKLPDETILAVFKYLDLISLCKCSMVNKHFNRLATDTMLYTQINLKPYWYCVSSYTLKSLEIRCQYLQKLDLSWCGNYRQIFSTNFITFIKNCGKLLTHLRLDCCKFVDNDCIKQIAETCNNIRELTIRNCFKVTAEGFEKLTKLSNIQRLDFYRTYIETEPLVKILKASPHLQHINLGSCVRVSSMDEVAQALGSYNKELVSVDFWKTHSLTPVGVKALSQCSKLEEVDLGWCLGLSIPGDCMTALAVGCPKLQKLFLAALRGIMDRDLLPFVLNCPKLQQIDLLGVRSITPHICLR
ncbi:hypothetical protein AAG570_009550 [Ranatra chinensis]|uniref:F-box domain-containing protein n=1 Tax=Ranatra chinensis TaxID=642074 RepID=A0ABD0YRJ9_9HEMI